MQLQVLVSLALASMSYAQLTGDDEIIAGVFNDVKSHSQEYLSAIAAGSAGVPTGLLNLYEQAKTYTDDSYTSLFAEVDITEVSSFATGLPWYSSRLETYFAEATANGGSSGSSGSSEASPSSSDSVVSGSSASSLISSLTESSGAASSSAAESSSGAESSGAGSSSGAASDSSSIATSDSSAGNSIKQYSGQVAYFLVPFVMVMAAPALL